MTNDINLLQSNQNDINRQQYKQYNATSTVHKPVEEKKNGAKILALCATALTAIGIAGIAIYKNKSPIPTIKDIKFNKGIATLKGKNFTGTIVKDLKDGKVSLEYLDGILQKSTKTGKKGFTKIYSTNENNERIIKFIENGKETTVNITQKNKQILDKQKKISQLISETDELLHPKKKQQINSETINTNLAPKKIKEKVWDNKDMKEFYTELERNSNKINELEKNLTQQKVEFVESLQGKTLKDLKEIHQNFNTEYRNFIKNVDPYDTGIKNIELTPEQKLQYKFLEEKEQILKDQREVLVNNIYEKVITKAGDKKVNVPTSTKYLDNDELEAFGSYYDNYTYNKPLRHGEDLTDVEEIQLMDRALKKAPELTEECVVYRGLNGCSYMKSKKKFVDSIKAGLTLKDQSYISTSIDSTNAQFKQFAAPALNGEGVILRIKLPKGTKGVLGGYEEFVLPRNSTIKINGLETIDGVKIAEAEYILP